MPLSAEISAVDPHLPSERTLRVPCYCEENIWRLAYRRTCTHSEAEIQYNVVFISNKAKCCPMFYQKASKCFSSPCFWDYHVVLLATSETFPSVENTGPSIVVGETGRKKETTYVLDLDSNLPYPCPLSLYLKETFDYSRFEHSEMPIPPSFRIIPAKAYLKYFFCDRMHMFDRDKQIWSSPPPPYECIMNGKLETDSTTSNLSNLDKYINMDGGEETIYGYVMTLDEIKQKFCSRT
jgi:hypothetical protein